MKQVLCHVVDRGMVFGVVISERYQLDTTLYAAAVTLTTLLSLLTLPVWFYVLTG